MPDDKVTKTQEKAAEKVERTETKADTKVEKTEAKAATKAAKAEEREPDMTAPVPPIPPEDPPLTAAQFNQREELQADYHNDTVMVAYEEGHPYFIMPDGEKVKAVGADVVVESDEELAAKKK